ncbi:MAG: efflux RND transporter periplasmic adaptor subunit [Gammaproteobacteria bacterium]|nr:efflux RND transporter periplasmic adaptor subunit [Gammaproteobacteria bacterium]
MKKIALPGIVFLIIGLIVGYFSQSLFNSDEKISINTNSAEKQPLYWVAPMDPAYRRDKPGKSPMGMDLVPFYGNDNTNDGEGVVKISPVVENNLGVRTAKVEKGKLDLKIKTVGYVAFDEDKLTHIHSRIDGWIEKMAVTAEGNEVKKDQKLFDIYSPTLVNAQEEYVTALKSGNRVLISASNDRLISYGVSTKQIKKLNKTRQVQQIISFYAQHDGFISKLNAREGMFVKPSTEIMSIGQLDTVWVIAEVFERQSGWVKKAQNVKMTLEAFPRKTWHGEVDYIYPILDIKTRTLRVRIRFDNTDHYLKPNMLASLNILSDYKEDTLYVKRESIIRNGEMQRIVKALGDGKYESVVIQTGIESGEFIEVLNGIEENDLIVTSAQFLIDSESSLTASFNRMVMRDDSENKNNNARVWVTGSIVDIMTTHNMLTIKHDPIGAWNQPGMIMDLFVNKSIDMSTFIKGQNHRFLIKGHGDGASEIIEIDTQSDSPEDNLKNNNQAWFDGAIVGVMASHNMLTIEHEPVDVWGWPEMSMDFKVSRNIDLDIFKVQQKIRFLVEKHQDDSLEIIQINTEGAKK